MGIRKIVIAVLVFLGALIGGNEYLESQTKRADMSGFREGFSAGYVKGGEDVCKKLRQKISDLRWNGQYCILD